MKKLGIMQGKGGNGFFPRAAATRAETVTVLLRMLAVKEQPGQADEGTGMTQANR